MRAQQQVNVSESQCGTSATLSPVTPVSTLHPSSFKPKRHAISARTGLAAPCAVRGGGVDRCACKSRRIPCSEHGGRATVFCGDTSLRLAAASQLAAISMIESPSSHVVVLARASQPWVQAIRKRTSRDRWAKGRKAREGNPSPSHAARIQ